MDGYVVKGDNLSTGELSWETIATPTAGDNHDETGLGMKTVFVPSCFGLLTIGLYGYRQNLRPMVHGA